MSRDLNTEISCISGLVLVVALSHRAPELQRPSLDENRHTFIWFPFENPKKHSDLSSLQTSSLRSFQLPMVSLSALQFPHTNNARTKWLNANLTQYYFFVHLSRSPKKRKLVPIIINSRNVRAISQTMATIFGCGSEKELKNRAKYNFHQFINYAWTQTRQKASESGCKGEFCCCSLMIFKHLEKKSEHVLKWAYVLMS